MLLHIIIVVSEPSLQKKLQGVLSKADTVLETARNQKRLWTRLTKKVCDLAVVSRRLIRGDPAAGICRIKQLSDPPCVVVLAEEDDENERIRLIAAGCDAVLNPALSAKKLGEAFEAILDRKRRTAQAWVAAQRRPADAQITDFVARSTVMANFVKVLPRVAKSSSSVLILGETGVGKERLARVLHRESPRKERPFIAVHCGALPESLLESELFGHDEGAFTGATKARRGCFEMAHQGTIFLDEIGEIPLHLQSKLLRVLEDRRIRRLGSEKSITVDVRIMAATNRDLEAEVADGQFRRDLFYRLNVMSLTVPPLRERIEDIGELVESYIEYLGPRIGSEVSGVTEEVLNALCEYSWPGNVRELINVIERAMLLCENGTVTLDDLPQSIGGREKLSFSELTDSPSAFPQDWLKMPLKKARRMLVEQFERSYLTRLLISSNGRVGDAAERAGIDARTLFDKMKRYDLDKDRFRPSARNRT